LSQSINSPSIYNKLSAFFGLGFYILTTVFLARLTIDIGTRMVHPFIPLLSTGLGLTIVGFSWLLFIRAMAGLMGPFFGILADKYGRRKIMATGLMFQCVGVIGVGLSNGWWAAVPMLFFGLALVAFIPAEQAYISDMVRYEKRGRALGAIEFSWATAGIIALPIMGWMIDTFGWRFPFFVLGAVSFVAAGVTWFALPAAEKHSTSNVSLSSMWQVFTKHNVLASVTVSMLVFFGLSCFITVWSIWLSADFGLGAIALGFVATAIGIAELTGSGLSSLFIDRIGKRKGSLAALLLTTIFFLLLPFTQGNFLLAITGLVITGVVVEFSVVSLITLYAEQAPEARATVFSLVTVGTAVGVSAGSPITAILWQYYGLMAVCVVAAASLAVAIGLVTRFLHDRSD